MNRSYNDTLKEIKRVQEALNKTTSPKLKSDYGKYLKKLNKNLLMFRANMERE